MAALTVHQLERRTIRSSPAVAPLSKRDDHRPQIAALFGEDVVVARRMLVVGHPLEDAFVDEVGEALVEHVAGDAKPFLEVVETRHAHEGVANDQQAPPLADDLQALADGAVHLPEAGSLHKFQSSRLRQRTHCPSVSCLKQLAVLFAH